MFVCLFVFYEDRMNNESPAPPATGAITPLQQMVASCSGAILTSLFGEAPTLQLITLQQACLCLLTNTQLVVCEVQLVIVL